jgi:zinc transporter ZupT
VFLISFATGVMLAIAFINLIPEASELYADVWLVVFGGFLLLYVMQHIIMFHPCHDEACDSRLSTLSTVGLALHSLLDGIVISVGFEANATLGVLTTLAVLLHKMPDGITITGILLHSGMERGKILLLSTFVALATPLGTVLAYFFLQDISRELLGMLLALTAGSFIYLASADLLPEAHKSHHRSNSVYFFFGIAVIALVAHLLPH